MSKSIENSDWEFSDILATATRLPGVRIDRDRYLRRSLAGHCAEEQIEAAIAETPAAAGVSLVVLKKIANDSIAFETTKVTALSAAAGIPGGLALLAAVPADMAQYFGHLLRIAQKLGYLYSWPDLFDDEGDELDDATKNVLILFVGVMFGASAANKGVMKLSEIVAAQALRQLPKQALTKGVVFPVVKTVATKIGVDMTKQIFARSVSKVIPVLGAVVSGGVTVATFLPMSKRLRNHLSRLELAAPAIEAPATV